MKQLQVLSQITDHLLYFLFINVLFHRRNSWFYFHNVQTVPPVCVLYIFYWLQQAARLNAKRPRPSEEPYFYYGVFVWIPLLHVQTEMDFTLFLSFFNGSSGEWYRPNLLTSVRATRVSTTQTPIEREALIIEWNLNLSWRSCPSQRHWEVDAPSPPTEALPDEK